MLQRQDKDIAFYHFISGNKAYCSICQGLFLVEYSVRNLFEITRN